VTTQRIQITDGQASATVPGPLHDGDGATFYVPAPNQWDVPFSGDMAAFPAFAKANQGKVIGLIGGFSHAPIILTDLTLRVVQINPIVTTVDASPGAIELNRCHGHWPIWLQGKVKATDFSGKPNGSEQHHGVRFRSGDIDLTGSDIRGFWGDNINYQAWSKADGGDGSLPLMIIDRATLMIAGRCNLAGSQFAPGSRFRNFTLDQAGAWAIDIEPNTSSDKYGDILIDTGTIGTHSLGKNSTWESGEMEAISFAGPHPPPTKHGPVTIRNVTGARLGMRFRDINQVTVTGCHSGTPKTIVKLRVDKVVDGGGNSGLAFS